MRCVYSSDCWAVRTCSFRLPWLWLARSQASDSGEVLLDGLPGGWRSGKIVREAGWLCTFSSPFASLPRTPCFSPLGTRARRCPKLKILTSSFSLFASAFSYLHSLGLFQALRALYFLFKGECSKQTGIRREALIWNFRLRLSSLVSCCFGDDI